MGISLPVNLPTSVVSNSITGTSLPLSLPFSLLNTNVERQTFLIPYVESVNLHTYHGVERIVYKEKATGQIFKAPYKEQAWFFPGLILSENVIDEFSAQLTLVENVQALILVDFELLSTNTLRITWYGNSVPSFTVMKKSAIDETYISDKTYNWNQSSAIIEIESEDYNIYLEGTANSGSSSVYTIGGTNSLLVEPKVEVALNDKIITATVEYTGEYRLEINY